MARLEDFSFRHDGCIFTFSILPELAEYASKVEGRKVFKDTEVLRIRVPSLGTVKQENCDEVTPDRLQFYGIESEYEKWKAGEKAMPKGAPLSELDTLSLGTIKTLEAAGVLTVEALIETDGALLSKAIGPTWREVVETAKGIVGFTVDPGVKVIREENLKMKDELQIMREQIAQLTAKGGEKPGKTRITADATQ